MKSDKEIEKEILAEQYHVFDGTNLTIARGDAVQKIWHLEGYLLGESIYVMKNAQA